MYSHDLHDIWALPVSSGENHPILSLFIHHQMFLDTKNKNMYGLGCESLQFSRYFGTNCLREGETTPYGHDSHTI
jgi:hypothetical protein